MAGDCRDRYRNHLDDKDNRKTGVFQSHYYHKFC
jgi:hypothetical protein